MEAGGGALHGVGKRVSCPERPLVIAHRGASGELPENTLPAYELAVAQGSDMIEIDLHVSRDDAIVITHDEELEGLGGIGEVADLTLEEIRRLPGGAAVPVLQEVLDAFGGRIPFNLELKRGTRADYPGMEAAVFEEVAARGLLEETLFSSFFDPVLRRLREVSREARIALLISRKFPQGAIERARQLGAEALNPERPVVTSELVKAAHGEGLAVYVFTVDDPPEMRRLLDLGVDGLFTNYPKRMRKVLASRQGCGPSAGRLPA
jgi:glycerophosphoryl diester phosphodiesterase